MNNIRQKQLLELLAQAQEEVMNGNEVSTEFARILFPPSRKEYELTYFGKESEQAIISQTFAVPLQENRRFGETTENDWLNKIIFGDNLQVLKTLVEMKHRGELKNADGTNGVRLVYIDPPFATKQDFSNKDSKAYSDKLAGAEFLEWLRKRLILLREVLSDDGTLYVHLDYRKSHYVKILLDEIFGEGNYQNEVIWQKLSSAKSQSSYYSNIKDNIFVYSKSKKSVFNPQYILGKKDDKNYPHVEENTGRKYGSFDFTQSGQGPERRFGDIVLSPPNGKHWIWSQEKIDEGIKNRRIMFTQNGLPRVKRYLDEKKGNYLGDIWNDEGVPPLASNSSERVNYPTQKPEKLLERIIKSSSNEGDLVLDCFGGSGTTAAVAEKLGRRWITVDAGKLSIYTIQKRILGNESHKSFAVYDAGLYDNEKLNAFDSIQWKQFAMALYNVQPAYRTINGLSFDGMKDGSPVIVYYPNELN